MYQDISKATILISFSALVACGDKDTDTDTGDVGTTDADGDGYPDDLDCEPDDASIYPGNVEACDGIDNNCDGVIDEGASDGTTFYPDFDQDGFGLEDWPLVACDAPDGYTDVAGDCDDSDPGINNDADEVCDGVDNNCDGTVNEDTATDALTWYADTDGDGHGDVASPTSACAQPSGYAILSDDCDDTASNVSPSSEEICDDLDNDCDGTTDFDGWIPTDYIDIDDAIDNAPDYSHICIDAGTVVGGDYYTNNQNLIFEGAGTDKTILDADSSQLFYSTAGSLDLRRMTIQNAEYDDGAVIYAEYLDQLSFRDVVIDGASCGAASYCYGAIYTYEVDTVEIEDVVIDSFGFEPDYQYAYLYGAVYTEYGNLRIDGLEITGMDIADLYSMYGFAYFEYMYSSQVNDLHIHDNTISVNRYIYGTVYFDGDDYEPALLTNTTIENNAYSVGGIYTLGPYGYYTDLDIRNLDIRKNTATIDYSYSYMYGAMFTLEDGTFSASSVIFADNEVTTTESTSMYLYGLLGYIEGDGELTNMDVTNNTFTFNGEVDLSGGILYIEDGAALLANNNIVDNTVTVPKTSDLYGTALYTENASVSMHNNNVTPLLSGDAWFDDDDGVLKFPGFAYDTDPLYADEKAGDYSLSTSSPMIDAGWEEILDADGSVSDVGAYGGPYGESWD